MTAFQFAVISYLIGVILAFIAIFTTMRKEILKEGSFGIKTLCAASLLSWIVILAVLEGLLYNIYIKIENLFKRKTK